MFKKVVWAIGFVLFSATTSLADFVTVQFAGVDTTASGIDPSTVVGVSKPDLRYSTVNLLTIPL